MEYTDERNALSYRHRKRTDKQNVKTIRQTMDAREIFLLKKKVAQFTTLHLVDQSSHQTSLILRPENISLQLRIVHMHLKNSTQSEHISPDYSSKNDITKISTANHL